jgi:signal transduction histidine kinase/ligand-binding sensor domain-containing protein/DNA-binding response OmpR family regulator
MIIKSIEIDYICRKITMSKKDQINQQFGYKFYNLYSPYQFTHLKRLLILFLLFPGFCSSLKSEEFKFTFEGITNDKGLTHNTVYDICQDSKGFMWFATDGGLNRYDGQIIKQYYALDKKRSLPSNSIACMVYTLDKKLFIGTSNGLALYKPETDDFSAISYKGKPVGDIISMQQGDRFELLISTEVKGAFRYNYKQNNFTILNFSKERIYGMTRDKEGMYWAFSRFGLYRFNKQNKIIAEYRVSQSLFNSAISYIKSDSRGVLWIGTFEKGLFTFNFKNHTFSPFYSSNGVEMYYIRTIEEGEDPNEYWIGTEKGLYILNIQSGYFTHYTQSFDYNRKTLNDNAVYKIYRNRQNVFFVGTYFGGVNIARVQHSGFNAVYPDDKPGCLLGKALGTMVRASDGKLWIATEDAGIAIFDKKNNSFRHLFSNEKKPNTISTNNVHALLMDHNICWAGHFMGGISKININTGEVKRFSTINNNPSSLSNNFVFSLHFLSPDSILVGTISGIDLFNKKTGQFFRFKEDELTDCFVYDMFTDTEGKIWICTYNKGIFVYDKKRRGLMIHYQAGDKSGLPGNSIISHCIDSKKHIWIGTRGNGLCLFNHEYQTFKTWNSKHMLIDDVVYGIEQDNKGMIWISSNKGISRLNFSDNTSIHFNFKHGIAGNQYNYKSYFKDNDGILYFGSVTGLTWFNPETILTQHEAPTVYFTNLRIFNELVSPDSTGILKKNIDFTNEIELKHNQNSFILEFSNVNYFNKDIAYQYYLEGFDERWSPISGDMQANYTNISPGSYTFHIRAINKIGNIVGPERFLNIEVLPPFWASWKAYLLYLILAAGIAYLFFRSYQARQREKVAFTIEKIEKENMDLLHQHKMNFFTYISHEFKTPLSIIIASVEMIFQKGISQNEEINEIQQTIKRSATRLLFLVNQLMEFRKIETDHTVIVVNKGNIIDFATQIISIYKPLVTKKRIDLNVKVSYTATEIYFDFDKLEKILTNLITNAVKFTPLNGTIELYLNVDSRQLIFSIKNSGKGFSETQKDKIFEVFYSKDFSNDLVESSGIGLALTAGLVKLLNGEITVESEPEKGCKFIVKLPCMDASNDATIYNKQLSVTDIPDIIDIHDKIREKTEITTATNKEFTLVIAEDNKDLLNLLYMEFKDKYHVKCFENGKDAWEYICQKTPDIVITDIMMPVMSGTELCVKIKTDVNLCHIPVIMLTAKTTMDAKLEGLQTGAEEYISKPFSMEELEIRLNNILTSRNVLKKRLIDLAQIEGLEIPLTNHELAFVEKVYAFINENMVKSELDVQFLANHLNISRTNLHNKMKILMNMNTSEFINTVRLNKAKELMFNETLSLSEISYKVGYTDSAYFTRIFKKTIGKTPGEYRKSIISKENK